MDAFESIMVDSGHKTGIYYIPVGNLPFKTTPLKLRDFASSDTCIVDDVEVFRGVGTGWIRVRGLKNFENTVYRLNNGSFEGRKLQVFDQNKDKSTVVRFRPNYLPKPSELVPQPPQTQPGAPLQQASSATQPPPPHAAGPWNQQGPVRGYSQSQGPAGYPTGPPANPAYNPGVPPYGMSGDSMPTARGFDGGPAMAGPSGQANYLGGPGYDSAGYVMPYTQTYNQAADPSLYGAPGPSNYNQLADPSLYGPPGLFEGPEPTEYVDTEPRKIVLTQLSRKATPEQLSTWINEKMRKLLGEIVNIDLPRQEEDGRLRGNAFIIFKTSDAANRAVKLVDQKSFKDRTVFAKVTIEGVSYPQTEPSHKESQPPRVGKKGRARAERKVLARERGGSQGSKFDKRDKSPGPLVVDGSTFRKPGY